MVRIVKTIYGVFDVYIEDDNTNYLLEGRGALTKKKAWEKIIKSMYQFNSNACLVVDETKKRHVIYRLYENGKKEKLPIKVRNSEANTTHNNQ